MGSLSKFIPEFVKVPVINIIGQECYSSLVEQLNVTDLVCLKLSVSKALGIGIVVGGSVMKIPQILIILSGKSAHGLSLQAYLLETASYAISTVYAHRNHYPFSTYGENFFLSIQNIFITFLVVYYTRNSYVKGTRAAKLLITASSLSISSYLLVSVSSKVLQMLQMLTVPLSVLSKLPQISQNHKAKSTGQLSAVAVLSQVAGCLARVFTTATEVRDPIVLAGFLVALGLNLLLGVQMWMYWGQVDVIHDEEDHDSVVLPQQTKEALFVTSNPTKFTVPNRKWSRKVD